MFPTDRFRCGSTSLALVITLAVAGSQRARASSDPERIVAGEVVAVIGEVYVRDDASGGGTSSKPLHPADYVYAQDVINTASGGRIKILMKDKTILDLGPSSLFKVNHFDNKNGSTDREADVSLAYGSMRGAVTQKVTGAGRFKVRTPSATMGVRGTEFLVHSEIHDMNDVKSLFSAHGDTPPPSHDPGSTQAHVGAETQITVLQGKVEIARNDFDASAKAAATRGQGGSTVTSASNSSQDSAHGIELVTAGNQVATKATDASLSKPAGLASQNLGQLASQVKVVDTTFQKAVVIDPQSLASSASSQNSQGSSGSQGNQGNKSSQQGSQQASNGNGGSSTNAQGGAQQGGPAPAGAAPPPPATPAFSPVGNIIADAVTSASVPPPLPPTEVNVPGLAGINQAFTPPPINPNGIARNLHITVSY